MRAFLGKATSLKSLSLPATNLTENGLIPRSGREAVVREGAPAYVVCHQRKHADLFLLFTDQTQPLVEPSLLTDLLSERKGLN